ncbi:MAG: FAD binding domain-containing protein [Acidimicrobiales bacterium]
MPSPPGPTWPRPPSPRRGGAGGAARPRGGRIGAPTPWPARASAARPPAFRGLQAAARQVGGVQIQNVATIGGNICNASPAADGVPPLLVLDAAVELRSTRGTRVLALSEFLLGNRHTERRPDELLTAVLVPGPPVGGVGSFEKLGTRAYLVISIVMVAALAEVAADGSIDSARVAVGACSPVARRLTDLERDLVGRSLDEPIEDLVTAEHLAPLSPIDDVRASAAYRLAVIPSLVARALRSARSTS